MVDRSNTRDRITRTAQELFHRRGFNSTSIADICKHAEVNSGSLYYFFPGGKEDLLLGVLDWYLDHLESQIISPAFSQTEDPIERVFAVLAGYRHMLIGYDFHYGCPVGNLAIEAAEERPKVAEKVAQNFTNWCRAIEGCFTAARDRLPADADPAALARFTLTVMEGGIMQARAHRDVAHYDACVSQLRDYVDRLVASKEKTR